MSEGTIIGAYIVPGLPHLTSDRPSESWEQLRRGLRQAGEHIKTLRPDALVIYSTQWISVLGHLFQADPNPKGLHVDDNWYEYGDFPFNLRSDVDLSSNAAKIARSLGLATNTVNYKGFPIDTGTLVALRFLNADSSIPLAVVSCNIYAGQEDSLKLGKAMHQAIVESGKRVVVVAVTGEHVVHAVAGNSVGDIKVGLDPGPNAAGETFALDEDGNLVVCDSIRWMVDFNEAVAKGLGVRIPITTAEAASGFDELLVIRPPKRIVGGLTMRF